MTEYESAGSWNELLDVLESRLTDKVNIEIEEAKQSRLVGSTEDYNLNEIEYAVEKEIEGEIEQRRSKIDINKEYDMFEYGVIIEKDSENFSESVVFHRKRKLTAVCVDGKPDHLQILWLLDSDDGGSDTVLFGSSVSQDLRVEFMRTRVGDRFFKYDR